jgi:putative phosphoribosyl transferase
MRFIDRADAGRKLAEKLTRTYQGQEGVVYALPRGGVVPAAEIARALHMPLDLVITRKIAHPANTDCAIGATTRSGEVAVDLQAMVTVNLRWFKRQLAVEQDEIERSRRIYFRNHTPISASGKTAILVDDGMVTGLTMEAAIRELRRQRPQRLVVAVPVAPTEAMSRLAREADEFVALTTPAKYLGSVAAYYEHFTALSDEQVVTIVDEFGKTPRG